MKNLKKYFNVIVTAVICFFMGMVRGKKKHGEIVKVLGNGQAVGSETRGMSGCSEGAGRWHEAFCVSDMSSTDCMKKRKYKRPRIRNVFFWLGGPGDRPRPDMVWLL